MRDTIIEKDLGVTAFSIMSECEREGIYRGCTENCPVLLKGECELRDAENKELWESVKE